MKLANILILSAVLFLSGCIESNFILSSESRLPVWVLCSGDCSRDALEVKVTYYTGEKATIEVFSTASGKKELVRELVGVNRWHPKTLADGILEEGVIAPYPHYVIIEINGVEEVYEHRAMEPIIYVAENPDELK